MKTPKNAHYLTVLLCSFVLFACQDKVEKIKNDKSKVMSSENSRDNLASFSQQDLNALAKSLEVKYRFLSNLETDCPKSKGHAIEQCYAAEIILTSPFDTVVTEVNKHWRINYSQVYPAYASDSEDFTLVHINGDIHQIAPKKQFTGFKAGQSKKVKVWIKSTLISESELMPNYWLSANNLSPQVIESTKIRLDKETGLEIQPYVIPFNTSSHIKSAANDINQYASTAWLYDNEPKTGKRFEPEQLDSAIIPTPKSVQLTDTNTRLDLSAGIRVSLTGTIAYKDIDAALARLSTLGVIHAQESKSAVPIFIELNHSKAKDWRAGHYQLIITKKDISISAQDKTGAFYALQSLAALVTLGSSEVPLLSIDDQPHYDYRGQHVDVARNFHRKEFIFALIKQMAAYKLNKLHLHLAEDEGWRLELPSLPELTQVGSKRCMDLSDKACLQPQLGGALASERDGFYSVTDYQEILELATQHHIQVIPSLDMPGHSRAAIKAMEARYHYYMNKENEVEAKRYLLTDFKDKTQYHSIQHYQDNTLNICMESTYRFVDTVLEDLKHIHQQAAHPLAIYHIGADETAGAWLESPVCKALIADKSNEVNDAKHLGAHFIERVSHMVNSKGITVGGWNDGLKETQASKMPKKVYSYIWDALPWGAHMQVSEQARRNWDIVLSTPDVLYFDFPYQVDPKEPGYKWASRRLTTRTLFNFMPDNLPIHAEFRRDTLGQPYVINDTKQLDDNGKITHKPLPNHFKVKGIQAQLWGETVRSEQQAEYKIYPRLLALAERAWHKARWQVPYDYKGKRYDQSSGVFTPQLKAIRDTQWLAFSETIAKKELAKLERAGVFYRLPTPGAKIVNSELKANVAFKGLPIEYQIQNKAWQLYQQPVPVELPVKVRARTTDKRRAGRALIVPN